MNAITMSPGFAADPPVDRGEETAAAAAVDAVKEKKMEQTLPPPAGTPFGERLGQFARGILPPVVGLVLLVGIWHVATFKGGAIPSPSVVWDAAVALFADPFYSNGPNDQGIGWNVLSSLQRVAIGFGFAALVGIPLGFMIGRFDFLSRMLNPIISLLRPVSPLAWLPIGLLVFKKADRRRPTRSSSARSGR
jgi:nitrate/nitrite transport system permease protein